MHSLHATCVKCCEYVVWVSVSITVDVVVLSASVVSGRRCVCSVHVGRTVVSQ